MTRPLLRLAMAAVRTWTRIYTRHLPPALGDARREEIESDLWASAHDPDQDDAALPLRICARLLTGIPDDVGWRMEQVNTMDGSSRLRIALILGGLGMLGLWLTLASQGSEPPPRPDAPRFPARVATLPPPPPPPPPPSPDGRLPDDVPLTYGDTAYVAAGTTMRPSRIKDVRPVHPPLAVWAGLRGTVAVEATIDERGRVAEARIVRPSIWMLDNSALNAVRQWEFEPTIVDGTPVPVMITATIDFTLR